jgi:predicted ATPase
MKYVEYIKISNFKIFGEEITINFDDTTVLIGPNNAGKTTVIQALALWQLGIHRFFDARTQIDKDGKRIIKGKLENTTGIGISRDDIWQVPNTNTRQLFYKGTVRTANDNTLIIITLGIWYKGVVQDCVVSFKYFKAELLYCYLSGDLLNDAELLGQAAGLNVNLLYPMSGLEKEETVLQEGAIRKQIGRGITAGLLRNICYNLYTNAPDDWKKLTDLMQNLFYIQLEPPKRLASDDLILMYNYVDKSLKTEKSLDILQAGRGQLQMLLILAFVLWRRNAVVMVDEPDAHLEVLRQSQVMEVLKKLADECGCQVILATHSEVIMNEAEKLTFLFDGKNINIDETTKKTLKTALKDFGIEHYYKANITKKILYLEGTTDKQNLIHIAQKINHPVAALLTDKIFVYYTQSPDDKHPEKAMKTGYYTQPEMHFNALEPLVEGLQGVAIFDNDNKNRTDTDNKKGLKIWYWQRYELENYFITPESVRAFAQNYFEKNKLFIWKNKELFEVIFETHFLKPIFEGNDTLIDLYKKATSEQQKALYASNSANKKLSAILDNMMLEFAKETKVSMLKKGDFYKIIEFCKKEDFDAEVKDKLDKLFEIFKK